MLEKLERIKRLDEQVNGHRLEADTLERESSALKLEIEQEVGKPYHQFMDEVRRMLAPAE